MSKEGFFLCSLSLSLYIYIFTIKNPKFFSSCVWIPVTSNPFQTWMLSSFFSLSQLFGAGFVIMSSWFSVLVFKRFMVCHLKYLLFHCQSAVNRLYSLFQCSCVCINPFIQETKCHKPRFIFLGGGIENTSWFCSGGKTVFYSYSSSGGWWICYMYFGGSLDGKNQCNFLEPQYWFCLFKHLMFVLTCSGSTT